MFVTCFFFSVFVSNTEVYVRVMTDSNRARAFPVITPNDPFFLIHGNKLTDSRFHPCQVLHFSTHTHTPS